MSVETPWRDVFVAPIEIKTQWEELKPVPDFWVEINNKEERNGNVQQVLRFRGAVSKRKT